MQEKEGNLYLIKFFSTNCMSFIELKLNIVRVADPLDGLLVSVMGDKSILKSESVRFDLRSPRQNATRFHIAADGPSWTHGFPSPFGITLYPDQAK